MAILLKLLSGALLLGCVLDQAGLPPIAVFKSLLTELCFGHRAVHPYGHSELTLLAFLTVSSYVAAVMVSEIQAVKARRRR